MYIHIYIYDFEPNDLPQQQSKVIKTANKHKTNMITQIIILNTHNTNTANNRNS